MKALAAAVLLGAALTVAIAWPVLASPRQRIFGRDVAGRHHDPFTVMWRFANERPRFPYRQPLVDDTGAIAAQVAGPVAAYNLIILLSFPLTVLATFLLARYLRAPAGAAIAAALAFAFAPPHVTHAAYHPHIAQTQWLPLYFLALWACVDRPRPARAAGFALAAAAVVLSNAYGALMAAVATPVVVAGIWIVRRPSPRRASAGIAGTIAALVMGVVIGRGILRARPDLWRFAADPADLLRYGARWWAYFVPPVEHPWWGTAAAEVWNGEVMPGAIAEHQISLSFALMTLAAVALWAWWRTRATPPAEAPPSLRAVPVLAALAIWGAVCSLAPTFPLAPAGWLYEAAPMFRAYARFALLTHLAIALLAGVGLSVVWRRQRSIAIALLAVAAIEYAALPPRSRDVLPTAAHRWMASQPQGRRALDCVHPSQEEALVPWLMQRDLGTLSPMLPSCNELNIAQQAATLGYTHLISRTGPEATAAVRGSRPGLALSVTFTDAAVLEVLGDAAPVIVLGTRGFSALEHDAHESWRFMEQQGEWMVNNPRSAPVRVRLEMELAALDRPRLIDVAVDDERVDVLSAGMERRRADTGPITLAPGVHRITFIARQPASRGPDPGARMLTVKLTDWRWWE